MTTYPTIEDVDRAVWLTLSDPPIVAPGLGALQLDGIKPASAREERAGQNGHRYWFWMRRLPFESIPSVGSAGQVHYEREGEGAETIFRAYTPGEHVDFRYELRYSVVGEADQRAIATAIIQRLPIRGTWIIGPAGIRYQAFGRMPSPIRTPRDDVLSERIEIRVPHVLIGRESLDQTAPAITEITRVVEPARIDE